ncbi:hypothetical protein HDC91_001963 [Mucilaginibacter sp. AK015]|nr:hypothetical protein [Mucilaginibacter sp. AK015]
MHYRIIFILLCTVNTIAVVLSHILSTIPIAKTKVYPITNVLLHV